jgi:acyl-lipid omega-3 desaturase
VPSNSINFSSPQICELTEDATKLPFTLGDLKAAIPSECFQPNLGKSLFYFFRDILIIGLLYAAIHSLDNWFVIPFFWIAQGTMFWALFVVGHDCGHQSFSKKKWLNDLIGHLSHTPILVPYHAWRISHATHHKNTGNIDNDESWYPPTESQYNLMPGIVKFVRYQLFLLAYPLYLFKRSPYKQGSHFLPSSPIFKPSEKSDIITSTTLISLMVCLLAFLTYQWGWMWLLKYYVGPYVVFVIWLDLVTFLHHTEADIPWYRGEEWNFLKGAISTIDRDYGLINHIHHDIGTHVAHHVFLNIPHYNLKKATEAIKPIMGDYFRKCDKPILTALVRSWVSCHFVPDTGAKVYYTSHQK